MHKEKVLNNNGVVIDDIVVEMFSPDSNDKVVGIIKHRHKADDISHVLPDYIPDMFLPVTEDGDALAVMKNKYMLYMMEEEELCNKSLFITGYKMEEEELCNRSLFITGYKRQYECMPLSLDIVYDAFKDDDLSDLPKGILIKMAKHLNNIAATK